jgi:hypothetical protein
MFAVMYSTPLVSLTDETLRTHNVFFCTLDTLRFDVAHRAMRQRRTPNFASLIPRGEWEERHTPGSFTYAAHQAFFAGFLPTPARPNRHRRLFAARFAGSETTDQDTVVFDTPDIVTGFASKGFHTVCVGGVGFFNQQNPLGSVLPALFQRAVWDASFGVTDPHSTENQVRVAQQIVGELPITQRLFLFLNVSALHQPNKFYLDGATQDTIESHAAALEYVDQALAPLFESLSKRAPTICIVCSDHGTAYGEDGFVGHRVAHPTVWTVPYAEFVLHA